MQNKAKFQKVKLNVNRVLTKYYEQMDTWSIRKTKPIQSQFKANSKPIKANIMPKQSQYKPKQSQFQRQIMMKTRPEYYLRGCRKRVLRLLRAFAHFVVDIEEFIVRATVTLGFGGRRKYFDLAESIDKLVHVL